MRINGPKAAKNDHDEIESRRPTLSDMESPGLLRLEDALPMLGVKRDVFLSAVDRGDIPIEVLRLGERRLLYVRASELRALLAGRTQQPA